MKKLIPPLFILSVLIGCNIDGLEFDELKPPTLDGTFAIPIGYVNYTMRELIDSIGDQGLDLSEDSTSLLLFTYRDSTVFEYSDELISFNDITNNGTLFLRETYNSGSLTMIETFDSTFAFTYPASKNKAVDSVFYETGELELEVSKSFPYPMNYEVTIQNTRTESGDVPVNLTGSLSGPSSSGSTSTDISDYKTILSYNNDQNTFEFEVSLDVILEEGQGVSTSDYVVFSLTYRNQTFDLIYGKVGQDTIEIGDEAMEISFFEELDGTGLNFGAPVITFDFSSSLGVPMGVLFGGIYAVSGDSLSPSTSYLGGQITQSPQLVPPSTGVGSFSNSSITIDRSNSSIQTLLSSAPGQVGFNLSAVSNPQDANGSNFVWKNSQIHSVMELIMPLEISLTNVTKEFTFEMGDGLNFSEADSLSFRITSENGLPFSALLDFKIVDDSTQELLYEIPSTLVLQTAFVDPSGVVTRSRETIADVPIGKDGVTALQQGGTLVLKFTLNTPGNNSDNTYIKVRADYSLDINVAVVGYINYQPK